MSSHPTVTLGGSLADRASWVADGCSIAATLEVISARSSFLLLREAFYGATRFDDLARNAGVSEPIAAARLREMVEHGLLAREPYREPGKRTRDGYVLTEKGSELFPVLVALTQWGDRWIAGEQPTVQLRHRACGARIGAEVRCADGHAVEPGDVELVATAEL